jgi:3-dehydroquinate synthase
MKTEIVSIKTRRENSSYDITIGSGLYRSCGKWAAECGVNKNDRVAIISNRTIISLYVEAVTAGFRAAGFKTSTFLIPDGEKYKNLSTLQKILDFLGKERISRTDVVVALGGGVVGDIAGFAASIHLRGIRFLQMPTTLLSMIDSSVGGKTGVNSVYGKNLIGSFYQPAGVLIDTDSLKTLPKRELAAGFCEAVKQGALSGQKLLDLTAEVLDGSPQMTQFLAAQVAFKAKVVQADERESTGRMDKLSRKILNFGHTFAHALEKATDYKYLKHGEAVGYGILFAAALSKKLELISQNEVDLLDDVVRRAGRLPSLSGIDPARVIDSFKYDKKVVHDSLQWVLLKGIGKPIIVPNNQIPHSEIVKLTKEFTAK